MAVSQRDYKIAIWSMLTLAGCFLVVSFFGYFYCPTEVYEFGVVVDISSRDIEVNLYRWRNSLRRKGTAKIEKMYTMSCDINVNQDNLDFETLRKNMFGCIRLVTAEIENFDLYNSTVFIYGTELTRLACKEYPTKCERVFAVVSEAVTAFEMRVNILNTKPLSGAEESFYGWISVNDYFNRLEGSRPKLTFGGLDLKNYSLLLSFEQPKGVSLSPDSRNTSHYLLYGNEFRVEGVDLMCYGTEQAYNRAILKYIPSTWGNSIKHPCYVSSYTGQIQVDTLFSVCLKRDKPPSRQVYKIIGDWNLEKCEKLIDEIIADIEADRSGSLKRVRDTYNLTDLTFFGFSRISEVASLVKFKQENLEQLYQHTVQKCANATKHKYVRYCFDLFYSYKLVSNGLGINPSNVVVGHKEKIETVTGSMVFNSKSIAPRRQRSIVGNFSLFYLLFSVFVFSSLGGFLMYKSSKIHQKRKQQLLLD